MTPGTQTGYFFLFRWSWSFPYRRHRPRILVEFSPSAWNDPLPDECMLGYLFSSCGELTVLASSLLGLIIAIVGSYTASLVKKKFQ